MSFSVLVAVIIVLVVTSKGSQAALTDSKREKNLCPCIHPHLRNVKMTGLYAHEQGCMHIGMSKRNTEYSAVWKFVNPFGLPSFPHYLVQRFNLGVLKLAAQKTLLNFFKHPKRLSTKVCEPFGLTTS